MRATLNIPDELVSEVQKISGERSKTRAIIAAMRDFTKKSKLDSLRALKGKVELDFDWREEEEAELKAQKARERHLEK
jgi:Arc/MetJ family transcription regulator